MIFALIPAAGQSTRMGRPKLALPRGNRSILEHVIEALRRAQVEHILVVIGPHVPELVPLAARAGAHILRLAEETPDMRTTVERGLRWLEENFQPRETDAWLLVPGDSPALDSAVVRQLLEARAARPQFSIVVPTFQGRRGHPVLIGWQHVVGIRALTANLGINSYLQQHTVETLEVPVAYEGILCDLDTPQDYERLRQTWQDWQG